MKIGHVWPALLSLHFEAVEHLRRAVDHARVRAARQVRVRRLALRPGLAPLEPRRGLGLVAARGSQILGTALGPASPPAASWLQERARAQALAEADAQAQLEKQVRMIQTSKVEQQSQFQLQTQAN